MKLPHSIRLALTAGAAATLLLALGTTAALNASAAETKAAAPTTWSGSFDGFPSSG